MYILIIFSLGETGETWATIFILIDIFCLFVLIQIFFFPLITLFLGGGESWDTNGRLRTRIVVT